MPGKADGNFAIGTSFTLRQFVEAGAERLALTVVVGGKSLDHTVLEPMMYRPGLALTGFFENFAWRRLQVIGKAEAAYLMSLAPEERIARIKALFDHRCYCIIFACGMKIADGIRELAEKSNATLLATPLLTREFVHLGSFVIESLRAPKMKFYGTTVEVAGVGVMMEGKAGMGKSETALGLIKHGNALVADDLTCLRRDLASGKLMASASDATRNYMEIRGIGIIHVPSVFGVSAVRGEKQLDLVITFKSMEEVNGELDRVGDSILVRSILGVDVPQIVIPVSAGRDLVNLVETACQQFKLRMAGHDPVGNLARHLKERAARKEGE